ncbi:MAG TPA: protease pro-enzyme activation domain-containing protein [Solirubrobacteraceae bacterium]|nr:protease pro-enzyme activation domain-containing protein [Solirubrobacteraceae bacterium]
MRWGLRRLGRERGLLTALIVLLLAGGGTASALAAGSPTRVRVGRAPAVASTARDIGGVAAATPMHVTVILKLRDAAALATYAREVSTPGSSLYRVFLTPAEFAARFGASKAQLRAVEASMRSHGLVPGAIPANRLSIPVSGTAAEVERAFSLSFRRRALPRGKVAVVANAAPAFDAGVAGDVQGVVGLSSVSSPQPQLLRPAARPAVTAQATPRVAPRATAGTATPCQTAQAAAASQGAYTADQIAAAYRFTSLYASGAEGQGQTVAIYELEPYASSDISAFESCYGIAPSLNNVAVDGGAGTGEGEGEAALDIEQAMSLAPRANFLVYEGPNSDQDSPGSGPFDTLTAIVSQDRARVVSISWGECEQLQGSDNISAESNLFEEAAAQGQSVVSATGDEGAQDCNGTNNIPDPEQAVDDPGSQPFVTGVGGTTMSGFGPPPVEAVWNHGGSAAGAFAEQGGAGGGGVSHAWSMPGYQSDAAKALHVIGTGSTGSTCANNGGWCREVPDVSADADPATGYIIYWNGQDQDPTSPEGWQAIGGTSAAAPVWAALLADADSSSACHGSAIGFANPALYAAAGAGYANDFNDITSGNNDYMGTNGGLYPAGAGYDMASGLGSPNAGNLAAALCADALRVADPGTQFSTVGQGVRVQVVTTALPGAKLTFYSSHLPPGLSISKSTGRITGKPKKVGSWVVGVAAVDQNLSLRAAFFTWRVGGAPKVSQTSLRGVGKGRPTLALTVNAGRNAPKLKAISLGLSGGLSFGSPRGHLTVTGTGGRRLAFTARVVRRRLQVTLAGTSSRIRVTIRFAAVRATSHLAASVRSRHRATVTVGVETLDAADHGVGERARIRASG